MDAGELGRIRRELYKIYTAMTNYHIGIAGVILILLAIIFLVNIVGFTVVFWNN